MCSNVEEACLRRVLSWSLFQVSVLVIDQWLKGLVVAIVCRNAFHCRFYKAVKVCFCVAIYTHVRLSEKRADQHHRYGMLNMF